MTEYWDGQGRGQDGDRGITYRFDGQWVAQHQGYSALMPDGSRGWRVGSWRPVDPADVPARIRAAAEVAR